MNINRAGLLAMVAIIIAVFYGTRLKQDTREVILIEVL